MRKLIFLLLPIVLSLNLNAQTMGGIFPTLQAILLMLQDNIPTQKMLCFQKQIIFPI